MTTRATDADFRLARKPEHDLTGLTPEELAAILRARADWCRQDRAEAEARTAKHSGRIKLASAESARLDDLIAVLVECERPMTVRSVFYRLVSLGAIEKTEKAYQRTDHRLTELRKIRKSGRVDIEALVDLSRRVDDPLTFGDTEEALGWLARFYKRDLWLDQDVNVWIGSEKDAISGVIQPITRELQVPLVVTHGYTSISQVKNVCESIRYDGKPVVFYQIGDHDPSGDHIPEDFEAKVRALLPHDDIIFERLAVTREQIEEQNLPTRPTKQSDTRAASWDGDASVEVDAIAPDELRRIVRQAIEDVIDPDEPERTRARQDQDKALLRELAA